MPYGYQYGSSGGLKSVTPGSPYRSLFPQSGALLMQLLQQKRYQQIQEAAERKRGQELADSAWRDAVKFDANPTMSIYKDYFQNGTSDILKTASDARSGKTDLNEVYQKMGRLSSELNKTDQFNKEQKERYAHFEKAGYFNLSNVNKKTVEHEYDLDHSGINGVATAVHPDKLNIDQWYNSVVSDPESYSPVKLAETFSKTYLEPLMKAHTTDATGPYGSIIQTTQMGLDSKYLTKKYTPSGQLAINIGEPGSNQSNQFLAQWNALSPDHAKYLDILTRQAHPDLDLSTASPQDIGILKQEQLQKVMEVAGHIPTGARSERVFHPPGDGGSASAMEKKSALDLKARVIYDLHSGNDDEAINAAKNLNGVTTDGSIQTATYDPANNTLDVTIQPKGSLDMMGRPVSGVPIKLPSISLNDPNKSTPEINQAWQRLQGSKSEVDTQLLMKRTKEMKINEGAMNRRSEKKMAKEKIDNFVRGSGFKNPGGPTEVVDNDPLGIFK